MTKPIVNNKPIKFVGTSGWNDKYGGMEGAYYIHLALQVLAVNPVDMLVFENVTENGKLKMQVRCAGYDLPTDSILDEKSVFFKSDSLEIDNFWLKIDNMGPTEGYVGTFLFPSEY